MISTTQANTKRRTSSTLQDVAREAGVTAMTVSVVLNGSRSATRVSAATRARIEEIAARLRYRPNAIARCLSRNRMDTLGVAATIDAGEINLHFLELLNGIIEGCTERGQNTTIFSVSDWEKDEAKLLKFCDGRVDGVILLGPYITEEFARTLGEHAPFVTIHGNEAITAAHNLEVANEAGAHTLTCYLISQGHRRIAQFTGPITMTGARDRLAGYRSALAEAGIPFDSSLVLPGYFTMDSGRECMRTLLDRGGPLPTAIFGANDAMAYGAMDILASRGIRVPEDISVAGFDDLMLARMTWPQLTTMRQPFRPMGQRAVAQLLSQIGNTDGSDDSEAPAPFQDIFELELVVRPSVGPPPVQRPLP